MAQFQVHPRTTLRKQEAVTIGHRQMPEVEAGVEVYAVVNSKTGEEFTFAYLDERAAYYIAEKFSNGGVTITGNFTSAFAFVSGLEGP